MNPLRALRHAWNILKADGPSALIRSSRRELARRLSRGMWDYYQFEMRGLVQPYDLSTDAWQANAALLAQNRGPLQIKTIAWFLPEFSNPYYGGSYTILRYANFLKTQKGIDSQFVIVNPRSEPQVMSQRIAGAFPALAGVPLQPVWELNQVPGLLTADAAVASLWNTAYYLFHYNQTRRKFYFVQDYEPLFYPAGSGSALIENTYRMGFYGLANTPSLKKIYEEDYGGQAMSFLPQVDTALFHPAPGRIRQPGDPYRVFFYGRPDHPRNAFELGAAALHELKQMADDRVQIVAAGDNWRPADHGLKGVVENLGLLDLQQTAELYRSCDAGLVLMFTRHPSYLPFELMASGCLVITNHNAATSWFLRDGENCLLSHASKTLLAESLWNGLQDEARRARITQQAINQIHTDFNDWNVPFEAIYQYMLNPEIKRK